jgi:hypothetical protein
MPRRKKDDPERSTERIPVPVTPTEKVELQKGADLLGVKVAAFLRQSGLREARRVINRAEKAGG